MQIGIFVDVANLYYFTGQKFGGRKIDYTKYWRFIEDFGTVQVAKAYGTQVRDEATGFIKLLKSIGFDTNFIRFKQGLTNDVHIALDMLRAAEHCNMMILGSGSENLIPAVEEIKGRGVKVVALAGKIHYNLRSVVTEFIELPESLLETPQA
jgi:uncharacterized LabA/DUF88 family protein